MKWGHILFIYVEHYDNTFESSIEFLHSLIDRKFKQKIFGLNTTSHQIKKKEINRIYNYRKSPISWAHDLSCWRTFFSYLFPLYQCFYLSQCPTLKCAICRKFISIVQRPIRCRRNSKFQLGSVQEIGLWFVIIGEIEIEMRWVKRRNRWN